MHLFAKLCKIFQNTIVHIHYKEKHIWKVMHFFTMIYIQSLPSYTSLLLSSSPRYHSPLDPQALYASSVGGLTLTAVPFCARPVSTTGSEAPESRAFLSFLFCLYSCYDSPHTGITEYVLVSSDFGGSFHALRLEERLSEL